MTIASFILVLFLLVSLLLNEAKADWIETAKLIDRQGVSFDSFGSAIAIDKGILAVGVPGAFNLFQDAGSVSIYQVVEEGEWSQQQRLVAGDPSVGDDFGSAVIIRDDTVAVGAPWVKDNYGNSTGAVYIYRKRASGSWSQQAKLVPSNVVAIEPRFGASLAMLGDTLIVGAPNSPSSVYIYTYFADGWSEKAKLTASDGIPYNDFGGAVAISEGTVVVGAVWDDDLGRHSGSAYLFHLEGELWTEKGKLTPSDGTTSDHFGQSVAMEGDTVCVSSRNNIDGVNAGAVYTFGRQGSSWSQQAKLVPSDTAPDTFFGRSLTLRDGMLVVGSGNIGYGSSTTGAVYLFRSVEDACTELAKLVASDGGAGNQFGWAADFEDGVVIAGAPGNNEWQGSVHVFEWRVPSIMPSLAPSILPTQVPTPRGTSVAFPSVETSVPTRIAVLFTVFLLFRD